VAGQKEFEGYQIYVNNCLMCHSEGIISSQRLDKRGWVKTIFKMKHFGANLEPNQEDKLIHFLLRMSQRQSNRPIKSSYFSQSEKFATASNSTILSRDTAQIYSNNCAQCHGLTGEGQIGPRLRGRLIPKENFLQAVRNGKNRMPAFGDSLSDKLILELWNYLQTPL
jgi:mono/diheme cytochrome c family protein